MIDQYAQMIEAGFKKIDEDVGSKLNQHNAEVIEFGKATKKTGEELNSLLAQHKDLHAEVVKLNDSLVAIAQKNDDSQPDAKTKHVGDAFVASDEFKNYLNGSNTKAKFTFENNTILEGTGNTVTRHDQLPGLVPGAFRPLTVMPTVASGRTTSNVVYYSRELLWTNAAAGTAEGAAKPESTLTFEEVTETVKTIPHFIKASKQALDDSEFLSGYINLRMSHGVRTKVESQIVAGDGVGQNYSGWITNATVTSPLLTTDVFGLASKMKYEVISADYVPDYFYFNPTDWQALEVIRKGAGDASFVGASGAVAYVNNGLTPLLWGLPVVMSNAVTAGTVICKSVDADMHIDRQQVTIEMFEQDEDNVQTNLVTIRGEARGVEAVMVPAAIRTGSIAGIT